MRRNPANRLLAILLALVMVLGLLPVRGAASELVWHETDLTVQPERIDRLDAVPESAEHHAPTDTVRVSIVLEDVPTVGAGFRTKDIALDQQAVSHDRALYQNQKNMEKTISTQALGGKKLDVVWNLTLVANLISAYVPYAALDAIRAVPGVREVRLEQQYSPHTLQPQTYASGGMVGAKTLWESGYTGAGSRVAIVDTGTDTDHQSFDNGAFLHSLKQNAADRGITYDRYLQQIDLLDTGDVNRVLRQLNVTERIGFDDASSYYISEKLPFGANYVDRNLTVDHDHDQSSAHGSHVAGIAAANRYIPNPKGDGYVDAMEAVSVAGAAPDAQIITMKVFGNAAGPYESDYFAAVEDAIWLGCDSVNLSLGMSNPGNSHNRAFADLLEFLEETDTVMVMSAGNAGQWATQSYSGKLYADDIGFQTGGEPGTYTNTLSVASVDSDGSGAEHRDDYTISSFSSWGVPGSLEMKPEIAAPGGNIWSINGLDTSGKGYEYQSGTSMAAPQVAGMTAQLAQYIREQGLEEKTGLSIRQLAQSLLMSTAVPLRETAAGGTYYSILAQGAGFGRVDLAAAAESCVLVDGQSDGKVKVELGEDAQRKGEYTFTFTLNNLTDKPMTYELRADLFTQNIYDDGKEQYLVGATRDLTAVAEFTSGGKSLVSLGGFACDLNGDSATTAADAEYLLEYLLGNVDKLHADGDVNGNNKVNSYDAHLLLAMETDSYAIGLKPGGSAQVEVKLTLTDETRKLLEEEYPTGAYIEGYVYAEPAEGVAHSIPVLGFYGSWTEPGMYDVGSWLEYSAGNETRMPYLQNFNSTMSNYVTVLDDDGKEYFFGGNPYMLETEYLPQRNAFNNQRGDMLGGMCFSLIRNAFNTRLILENRTAKGKLLSEEMGGFGSSYYNAATGYWANTQHRIPLGLNLAGISDNTQMELRLEAAPELYRMTGSLDIDWAKVQSGGVLSFPFAIDNSAPQVLDIRQEGNTLRVKAKDNQYIAAIALMNAAGTETLAIVPGDQRTSNSVVEAKLDLSGVYGREFLVGVYDYARNGVVCKAQVQITQERPRFTAADQDRGDWYGLTESGTQVKLTAGTDASVQAAEYVDGYVFRVDKENRLWVGSDEDLYELTFLSELDPTGKLQIAKFQDLAYSTQDKTLYGIYFTERNSQDTPYLCTIDLYTGALTELGALSVDIIGMTIDDSGTFYGVSYGFDRLYTFRADNVTTKKHTQVGNLSGYKSTGISPMAWDHEKDELYWAQTGSHGTNLLRVDPTNGSAVLCTAFPFQMTGLYIAGSTVGNTFAPTDRVTAVKLPGTARTIRGGQVQLSAQVLPWNIRDNSVTWSSSNKQVATVDAKGLVTGVSGGTAVITAASKLDSSKKATCTVTIEDLSNEMKGILWDEEGNVSFVSFDTGSLPAYRKLADVSEPLTAATYHNGTLYASSLDLSAGQSDLYTVNPKTFAMKKVGASPIAYTDLCYAPSLDCLMATYFGYICLVDPETGDYFGSWEWDEGQDGDLVGITYAGSQYNDYYGAWADTFLILDNRGKVYKEAFIYAEGEYGYFNGHTRGYLGNMGERVDYSYFQGFHFDGSYLYWSRFNNDGDNVVELRMMDVLGNGAVYSLGYFPEGIWPVGGLYTEKALDPNVLTAETAQVAMLQQPFADPEKVMTAGTLNSVVTDSTAGLDQSGINYVDISYDRATTNGIFRVEYDGEKLAFAGLESGAESYAIREADGVVEVAFAHGSALPAGTVIGRLGFRALPSVTGGETTVTVHTRELGQQTVTISEKLTMKLALPMNPFTDVPEGEFYHIPVLWAVARGITTGATATTFNPNGDCQRAAVVTFLWRAAGSPEPATTKNPFTDVKKTDFFYKAVLWAVEKGITNGMTATTFGPYLKCNRAQVVTFLWRSQGQPGSKAKVSFTDVKPGQFYSTAVAWAVEQGVTNGMGGGIFGVDAICNRAQVVTFLYRTFE